VFRGWYKALVKMGHQVKTFDTNHRLMFYGRSVFEDHSQDPCGECGRYPVRKALEDPLAIASLSTAGLFEDLVKFGPEIVFFVSGFFQSGDNLRAIRQRGHKIVMLHTESPYQDDEQMERGQWANLNLLNDPANIEKWADLGSAYTAYVPHSYDPDVHYPDWDSRKELDFSFIGTAFKSRCEFFQRMLPRLDAPEERIGLGGNAWDTVDDEDQPLLKYLRHPADQCVDNDETARVYRMSKTGINFYRRESEDAHQGEGVAMGPREVEMAACGMFFARDPRPESDRMFPFLPSFSTPEEAADILSWYLARDEDREDAASLAQTAVQDWTFDNRAREVFQLMERLRIV
jgi:spore maturation protein CgeB